MVISGTLLSTFQAVCEIFSMRTKRIKSIIDKHNFYYRENKLIESDESYTKKFVYKFIPLNKAKKFANL